MNPPSHPLEAPHPLHPSIPLSAFQCDEIEEGNGPGSPKRDRKGQTNDCDEIKIDVEPVGRVKAAQAPMAGVTCSNTTIGFSVIGFVLFALVMGGLALYLNGNEKPSITITDVKPTVDSNELCNALANPNFDVVHGSITKVEVPGLLPYLKLTCDTAAGFKLSGPSDKIHKCKVTNAVAEWVPVN
eukprot:52167_1